MKQARLWFLMGLLTVGAIAAAVTPPTDLSLQGIVEWVGVGGHIASGSGTFPAAGAKGARYTDLTNPNKPLEYRSNGTYWKPIGTWNHAALDNLLYSSSGHGPVPMAYGGTGGIDAESARTSLDVFSKASTTALIPLNASFTFDGLSSDVSLIDFATTLPPPAYQYGRMFWDGDNSCPAFYPDTSNAILQIGQEIWVKVKNSEVATMTNGTVVYLSSPFTGKEVPARLALADAASTSAIIGVVTHDIAPDGSGFATVLGLVRDLNTAAFTEGSKVFLSATTPGSFTATVPAAPNCSVIVGYVLKSHANAGVIYVRVWLNGSLERATFAETVHFAKQATFATAPVFTDAPGSRLAIGFPNPAGKSNYVLAVGTDTSTLYWSPVGGGDGGVSDHSLLTNLDYALSGHTGFAASTDLPNNASFTLAGLGEKSYWSLTGLPSFGTMASETATNYVATGTFTGHTDATAAHGVGEVAGIEDIPLNASFSFDLLSDSPDYTGNGDKVLGLNTDGTALEWKTVAGVGPMSHATLSDLDYAGSGHTGFAASSDLAAYQPIASMGEYALDTDIPNNASFTLTGLGEKSYWSLDDLPTFGTMASETATDYTKTADLPDFVQLASEATGPATFSYTFDVATLTVGGVDVLGDVHSALAEILGEW